MMGFMTDIGITWVENIVTTSRVGMQNTSQTATSSISPATAATTTAAAITTTIAAVATTSNFAAAVIPLLLLRLFLLHLPQLRLRLLLLLPQPRLPLPAPPTTCTSSKATTTHVSETELKGGVPLAGNPTEGMPSARVFQFSAHSVQLAAVEWLQVNETVCGSYIP